MTESSETQADRKDILNIQNTTPNGESNLWNKENLKDENLKRQQETAKTKEEDEKNTQIEANEIIAELGEYPSLLELINKISDKTDKEWIQDYINTFIKTNNLGSLSDQELLKKLGSSLSLEQIGSKDMSKFINLVKARRIFSHLETWAKVPKENMIFSSLQKYINAKNRNSQFETALFSNVDVIKAFEDFQKNKHMQDIFKAFVKNNHPEVPAAKVVQASEEVMKEFFTSPWHQEVLVQMLNRQKDEQTEMGKAKEEGTEIKKPHYTAKYMRDNMYYRSIMRLDLQEMEIDKKKALTASQENGEENPDATELIQERFEKLKADKEHFAKFSRAKTTIVKDTVKENNGDVSAEISTKVEALLNTEVEDKFGKRTYKEILKQGDLIKFFGKTIIGAIRTKEWFDGEPIFEPETRDGDITDIQLLGYLYEVGKYATVEEKSEQKLELNINMSNDDKDFLAILRELKIGRDTETNGTNSDKIKNSKLFAQMQAAQKRIEQESAQKLAIQQERAKNFKWGKNRFESGHQEKDSSNPSTLNSKDNLSKAKGKDVVAGNASINAYLDELQKGESIDSKILEKWRTTGNTKALSGYIARTTGIPYEEVKKNCFRDETLKTDEELIAFLKTKNQLSDNQATEIIKGIKEFTPTQVESIIEEKSKRYMDNNKEIKEFALGGVFDYIKESLNVTIKNATTGSPQNFAEKFSFDDKESVKIENGELVIKGKIDGVSTDFYYNLNKGGIYTTPNIGRIGDVYRIHNKHDNHNSENNSDHTRIALIPDFPSFDGVIKLTKKGISRNKVAFEEAKKLSPTERGSVIHKLFHSSLENNSLLSDVDQNREKFLKQVETDQFMESCFTTFQIKFEGNSVEKAKDKDAFHLLQVLEQSTWSKEEARKGQECISLLKSLTNINAKLQNTLPPEKLEENWVWSTQAKENVQQANKKDIVLENLFSKTKLEENHSRIAILNKYLSAYSTNTGEEEKINFDKLLGDLNSISKGEKYDEPAKLTAIKEEIIDPHPIPPEKDKKYLEAVFNAYEQTENKGITSLA